MNWLRYLAEANIYLGVFYLAYCLLLNRDTHHQLKRCYLVTTCIVAFVIPVLQLGALKTTSYVYRPLVYTSVPLPPVSMVIQVPPATAQATSITSEQPFSVQQALWYLYLAGVAVSLLWLLTKLYALFRLVYKAQRFNHGKHRLIYLPGTNVAFSFFNYLFIGNNMPGAEIIIRHELVHIRQKHSADVLFLELVKTINWFNPFVYLLQNSLKTVHEYIADEQTAAFETDALSYSSFLLMTAYSTGGSSVTHSFFNHNILKKRIIMLNQQRSGNLARLKYLVALPVCAALLCASTLAFSKTYAWVDLAPAHFKPSALRALPNANSAGIRKRLKITKDGISTITDQFAIGSKNQRMVYTAGTITKADRSALLRDHHIEVDIIADSSRFTTRDGRLILPVVNADGYHQLDHYLHNNINYKTEKGDKGGLVEIGFSLDNDRHIIDPKVVKSGGPKLDALALNSFKNYKGIVTDDAGKNYKLGVYFFTDDYSIFKTDSLGKDPAFAGEVIITNYKYPVEVTSKGYEYDESGVGFPGDDNNMSNAKVLIFEKNGDATWFYRNKSTPADLELLHNKYGYSFPSASSTIVQMMNLKNVNNKRLAYIFDVSSYLEAPYANHFYNEILNNITYPPQAKTALTGGVVLLNFNLDNSGMISDVAVARSAGNGFDEAAANALRSYRSPIKDVAGKHSIAIVFCVTEKKYRPVVSGKINKEGYAGELAVSDVRSPFSNYSRTKLEKPVIAPATKTDGN